MSLPRNLQGLRSLWRALCVALHKTFSWTTPTTVYPKTDLPLEGASPQLAAYPNLALGDTLLSCLHFSSNGDIFFQRVIRQTKSSSDKGGEKKNFRKYKSKKKKKGNLMFPKPMFLILQFNLKNLKAFVGLECLVASSWAYMVCNFIASHMEMLVGNLYPFEASLKRLM